MRDVVDRDRARARRPALEGLELRELPAAALPNLAMQSATTADSRTVTVRYEVQNAPLVAPWAFAVERSATPGPDAGAKVLATLTIDPSSRDNAGVPAGTVGTHTMTLAVPGDLPIEPKRPYVVVAADPANRLAESNEADNVASFRTHVIGVITHGGLQPKSWKDGGPPWERQMADALRQQGYDAVIAYNWVGESSKPGAAAKQGPRLANLVERQAAQFPAGDVVDLHVIGHSEGAVVNYLALKALRDGAPPNLQAGYVKDTMLDPHAANNSVPGGKQYSVSGGIKGGFARVAINNYQAKAKDPLVRVPDNVDDAEAYYQHTPISLAPNANNGLYNLWGQVPVPTDGVPVQYGDLSGYGVDHLYVHDWYLEHVVPTLGDGGGFVAPATVTGSAQPATGAPATASTRAELQVPRATDSATPTFTGTAPPGSTVTVMAARVKGSVKGEAMAVGTTTADAQGRWSVASRTLTAGSTYQFTAIARVPASAEHARVQLLPRVDLGTLTIGPTS